MNIYIPYFYIIQHKPSGVYYAGSKTSNHKGDVANPNTFWVKYFTSSKSVKSLIENDGTDAFIVRKLKPFNSKEKALEYESKFLKRVNAKTSPLWLNKHNNDILSPFGSEAFNNILLDKHGVSHNSKMDSVKQSKIKSSLEKYGVQNPMQNKDVQTNLKSSLLEKYGVDNYFKSEEFKTKSRETNQEKYGAECFMKSADGRKLTSDHFRRVNQLLKERESVKQIYKYMKLFKAKPGKSFHRKSEDQLKVILDSFIEEFGVI